MTVSEIAKRYETDVVRLRREFHQMPEASLQEVETSRKIMEELGKIGIESRQIADTGVIATIQGGCPGKTVALRADIDALSVEEKTGAAYASQNPGFMHACGHDAHIAMLLGAAKILNDMKSQIKGQVRLMFEPGEEVAKGALKMIAAGAMEGVDTVFGLHVWSDLPMGTISLEAGPRMASADFFFIDVKGKSCHGSMPQQGIDAVIVGTAIVNALQTVVSREINPLEPVVISVCEFKAGSRFNVVAGDAHLTGTTRTFNREIREQLPVIMERVLQHTAAAFRAEVSMRYDWGSSPVTNDARCSEIAIGAAEKIMGKSGIVLKEKTPGGENFSEYQSLVPGVFGLLGVGNPAKDAIYPQHSDHYQMDEDALILGSQTAAQYALDYLEQNQ